MLVDYLYLDFLFIWAGCLDLLDFCFLAKVTAWHFIFVVLGFWVYTEVIFWMFGILDFGPRLQLD